jgi:hypothetical protein
MEIATLIPPRGCVVVLLDADKSPSAVIVRPDLDTIKFCKRCENMMEALAETPCKPTIIWGRTASGAPVIERISREHELTSVQAPANPSVTRTGVVVTLGKAVSEDVRKDMHVVFHFATGRKVDEDAELFDLPEYRIIREDAILGELCE